MSKSVGESVDEVGTYVCVLDSRRMRQESPRERVTFERQSLTSSSVDEIDWKVSQVVGDGISYHSSQGPPHRHWITDRSILGARWYDTQV